MQAYERRPDVLTVLYDGQEVAIVENLQFQAIDFGNDSCRAPCAKDKNESLAEMFLYQEDFYVNDMPNMTWAMIKLEDG